MCRLIKNTRGYRMGKPGERKRKRTHSLFIDDLKVHQENHKRLEAVHEMIVQASHDTGACYGVSKCAEIVFERGKMINGEGLPVLQERTKTIDPDDKETYKSLGVEQSDGIKKKDVTERVKIELIRRLELLNKTELNDENLMTVINSKVIPVAAHIMNICRFTKAELSELVQIIIRELRDKSMLGRQSSDERLYLKRENGGRGLKSMRDVYRETKLRIACYMEKSESPWKQEKIWDREKEKEYISIWREAQEAMLGLGKRIEFDGGNVTLEGERLEDTWKETWGKSEEKHQRDRVEQILTGRKNCKANYTESNTMNAMCG